MGTPVGSLTVEMILASAKFQADLGKQAAEAVNAAKRIERGLNDAKKASDEFNAKLGDWGKALLGAAGITLSIEGLLHTIGSIKEKTIEGERSFAALNATLKATQGAAGLTAERLETLNKQVQGKSVFSGNDIRQAEAALLRFRTIQQSTFEEALRLIPDVATALGTDLPTAAQAVGRALTDPEAGMRALRAAGIFLSESQKDLARHLIETGNKAAAQKIILDELARSVGGAAEGDRKGLYGATKLLSKAFDDLQEKVGKKLFGDNHAELNLLTKAFEALGHHIEKTDLSVSGFIARLISPQAVAAFELVRKLFNVSANTEGRTAGGKIDYTAFNDAEAARQAAAAKEREIDDQRYIDQKNALKHRVEQGAAFYASEAQRQKSALDIEQLQLENSYAHQGVTVANFFAKRRDEAQRSADEQFRLLSKQGHDAEALLSSPAFSREEKAGAADKLQVIANQQQKLRLELQEKLVKLTFDEADAQKVVTDEITKSGIRLLELTNEQERAAERRFRFDNREKLDYIVEARRSGTPSERRNADALAINLNTELRILTTRARYNDEADRGTHILDALNNAQARIELQVKSGQITEIDGLNQLSALNKSRIGELQTVADKLREIAVASGDPKLLAAADAFSLKIAEIATQTDLLADKFQKTFRDSFAESLEDAINNAKSLRDFMTSLGKSLSAAFVKVSVNNVADTLFKKGGLLGDLGGIASSIFGGGDKSGSGAALTSAGAILNTAGAGLSGAAALLSTAAAALSASAAASAVKDIGGFAGAFDLFSGFAGGTNFAPGGMALVGERGPEVVNLPRGSQVIPNSELVKRRGQRGGDTHVNVNMTNVFPEGTSRQTVSDAAATIGLQIGRAVKRNR